MSFAELCQRVEGVSGSLEKVDLVAAFLKNLDDDELAVASGFIMGDLFSPSMDLVMGGGAEHPLRGDGTRLWMLDGEDIRYAARYRGPGTGGICGRR